MSKIKVKISLKDKNIVLPRYMTSGSAGMDVCAYLSEDISLDSLERKLIPTGISLEIPKGYEVQLRPRSGLALKHGITLINSPGTIDSDYRGEIGIVLVNLSKDTFVVKHNDRIAQMVLSKHEEAELIEDRLDKSERGLGGFGHTGK